MGAEEQRLALATPSETAPNSADDDEQDFLDVATSDNRGYVRLVTDFLQHISAAGRIEAKIINRLPEVYNGIQVIVVKTTNVPMVQLGTPNHEVTT